MCLDYIETKLLATFLFQALAYTAPASFECPHELYLGVLQEDEQWLQAFSVPPTIPVHFAAGWIHTIQVHTDHRDK